MLAKEKGNNIFHAIWGWVKRNPVTSAIMVYIIAAFLLIPNFAVRSNLESMIVQVSDIIIVACGMTFVYLNASIDFSVVAVLNLSSVVGAMIMNKSTGLLANSSYGYLVAMLAMLVIGAIIGVVNGLSVVFLKMPSFIVTMTTQLAFSGLALVLTQSVSIANLPTEFLFLGSGKILGFMPVPVLIAAIVVAACFYILRYTIYGRKIYAVGTNPSTSFVSGISVKRCVFSLFVICGILAGIASIVLTARTAAGVPFIAKNALLDIVAAVMIGGMNPKGGEGTIGGTVMGALMIAAINNSLNMSGLDYFWIVVVKGCLVLTVAIVTAIQTRDDR